MPGFTINRICAFSLVGLARTLPHVAETSRKWATTGIGLGVIPFIVHPIDTLIHTVMDNTTRYQHLQGWWRYTLMSLRKYIGGVTPAVPPAKSE